MLPTRTSFCTRSRNGGECEVPVFVRRGSSAIPVRRVRSPHCARLLSEQTRQPMQLQTECSQPSSSVAVGPDCCHLDSASPGLRGSGREAAMTRRNIALGLAALAIFAGLFYF